MNIINKIINKKSIAEKECMYKKIYIKKFKNYIHNTMTY